MMFRFVAGMAALWFVTSTAPAQVPILTVETIMQEPTTWVGSAPQAPYWTLAGGTLYFAWNPDGAFDADSLFAVDPGATPPRQLTSAETRTLPPRFSGWHHGEYQFDARANRFVFTREGDVYLYDRPTATSRRLTGTRAAEANPRFVPDGGGVVFAQSDQLYQLDLMGGGLTQLTDLRSGTAPASEKPDTSFLAEQQTALFTTLSTRQEREKRRVAARERENAALSAPPIYYYGKKRLDDLSLDPSGRFVAFTLWDTEDAPRTAVFDFVTESGFAEERSTRPKVGQAGRPGELYLQDLQRDTTYRIDLHTLPGAFDVPAYRRAATTPIDSAASKRALSPTSFSWKPDGSLAIVEVRAADNKDRWIARLDPKSGVLTLLHRQTDDAWIAGPGIGWVGAGTTSGWMADGQRFFFQSEHTGYSHLYTVDVTSGVVAALTSGDFEVFDPMLSRDGQTWFFTSSEGSPFERHFYRMPANGGTRTRLTRDAGNHEVALAPDEKTLATRFSSANRPPEVYRATIGQSPQPLTHSTTPAWEAYPWRDPEIVHIPASDGANVPARLYRPDQPNGGAVLFVHGAGYLQNVHRWWSTYFREYMFHNLLADQGYVVLDVDYRGSAGYGRDWRTAIYRHMGGRDLQDFVDASRYAGDTFGIDPERVFIYGGSYGGFITLMALFTEPEHFGGGAALRSVTDWAHYNHPYTANILNTPETDSLAYARSSPIYFAEGLQDPLLIAHGMVDTNVHFQDVVRLAQRLIELGKTDWEMAVYPVENHGFTEPSSWTDEYRRILRLIEQTAGRSDRPD